MQNSAINLCALHDRDIFAVRMDDKWLVYAPLSGVALMACNEEMNELVDAIAKGKSNECIDLLTANDEPISRTQSIDQITELSILINQRCNFSCSYCYSARGRSSVQLHSDQLNTVMDYFISRNRGDELSLVFSGGGDPMLSAKALCHSIEYARKIARNEDVALSVGIVTNGSLLSHPLIEFIKQQEIDLVVSFDILEEVHNQQRSHYETVTSTIDHLIAREIQFGIRSTITPLNVARQVEMIEELHHRFPQIKSVAFEAVLNKELYPSAHHLREFYASFVTHYFLARDRGEKYGILVGNTVVNSVDCCKERACLGKLVLTPEGTLSACSRISSHSENHFEFFKYGEVTDQHIAIDQEKYHQLFAYNNRSNQQCHSCIAKWHCSGGCLLAKVDNHEDDFAEYCRFMQAMVCQTLIRKIEEKQ